MTTWGVVLDPPGIGPARTSLNLNDTSSTGAIRVDQAGINWGDAVIQAYMSDAVIGSGVVDYRIPNRMVSLPLFLGASTGNRTTDTALFLQARSNLQRKVALLQREGGILLRQTDVDNLYADVVNATLTFPDKWGESGSIEPDVHLTLECLPDFYGDEITLDSTVAPSTTGVVTQVLQQGGSQAVIAGDYPARCRLIVTDASGRDQHGLIWGFRSRHYVSSITTGGYAFLDLGSLFWEAENMETESGAGPTLLSTASGGYVVSHLSLPAGVWAPIVYMAYNDGSGSGDQNLVHTGTYRVWARCFSSTATPQFQLVWGVGTLANPVTNDPVVLPAAGAFYMLDLGTVFVQPAPLGPTKWSGIIQAQVLNASDPVMIDCVYFQPLDESAGSLSYAPFPATAVGPAAPTTAANDASVGTQPWINTARALTKDGILYSESLGSISTSNYLKMTGFGFALPSLVTITGIQVNVGRWADFGNLIKDNAVRLVKAGTIQTTDRSKPGTWSTRETEVVYGGPNDLWGGTWLYSDINASTFGMVISAVTTGTAKTRIDYVTMTVYYTVQGGYSTSDAVIFANRLTEIRTDGVFRHNPPGTVYGPVSTVVGDLPRLPPSGNEGRPVEVFVKTSEGDLGVLGEGTLGGIDQFAVSVKYRPCYLFRS